MFSIGVQAFLYESCPELVHSVSQANWSIVFQQSLIILLVQQDGFDCFQASGVVLVIHISMNSW